LRYTQQSEFDEIALDSHQQNTAAVINHRHFAYSALAGWFIAGNSVTAIDAGHDDTITVIPPTKQKIAALTGGCSILYGFNHFQAQHMSSNTPVFSLFTKYVPYIALALAALIALDTLYWTIGSIPYPFYPYSDGWIEADIIFNYLQGKTGVYGEHGIGWLLVQHGDHRPLTWRFYYMAEMLWLQGRAGYLSNGVFLCMVAAMLGSFLWELWRFGPYARQQRWLLSALGVATFMGFWTVLYVISIHSVWVFSLFSALLSFFSFFQYARVFHHAHAEAHPVKKYGWLAVCFVFAFLCAFSLMPGPFIGLMLALVAFRIGLPRWQILGILGYGLLIMYLYFDDYTHRDYILDNLRNHPGWFLHFLPYVFGTFLNLLFLAKNPAWISGVVLLCEIILVVSCISG
jgi:hypothetical protein